MPPAEEDEAVL
jgi:hypothetical protein